MPIVTGEELYTRVEFREVFERRAADIINPDVCNCGGILELQEIAAMAEAYHVVVSPHNYNSTTVGLAATLQVSAAIPNFLITEYFVNFEARGREIARPPFAVEDGYIALPTAPGLGIDLDEAALARRLPRSPKTHTSAPQTRSSRPRSTRTRPRRSDDDATARRAVDGARTSPHGAGRRRAGAPVGTVASADCRRQSASNSWPHTSAECG